MVADDTSRRTGDPRGLVRPTLVDGYPWHPFGDSR